MKQHASNKVEQTSSKTDPASSNKEQPCSNFDPIEFAKLSAEITAKYQSLLHEFMAHQESSPQFGMGNFNAVMQAYQTIWAQLLADPKKLAETQLAFWQDYSKLVTNSLLNWSAQQQSVNKQEDKPAPVPPHHDKRFQDQEWEKNPLFRFIRDAYLLTAQHIQSTVDNITGLEPKAVRKINFYTRQFVNALAPSNFVMTNPEVLRATIETHGENLLKGLRNMLDDLKRGNGQLAIKMTDLKAFKIGENLAITPGKVVFQNDLIQLIQYEPTTKNVHQTPLLIIPPWINKYYILDLQAKNSFVKYIVDQGYTVFLISWVNPDKRHAHYDFSNYMQEGSLAAVDVVTRITGEQEINALGFCIGGTLLACTLSYMAVKKDKRIKAATFLATLLDFEDPGDIEVFIDEDQISSLEARMAKTGYLDGGSMSTTFNLLRSNELIWAYFVNNYLHGKEPFPFDLLYWNSDSTNMPASMHSMYLREMYLHNRLKTPGGIILNGVPIDLSKITIPAYFLATQLDHIAPWQAVYAGRHLYGGPVKFVVGGSGHVAGIINPPINNKYDYRTNIKHPKDPDEWLKTSSEHEGSWWPNWIHWLKGHSGENVPARKSSGDIMPIIEDAPGSYVRVRLSDIT